MIRLLKMGIFAVTAAYIALLPNFYLIFNESNRFNMLWDRTYHTAIVSAVLILAVMFGVAYALACKVWKQPGARLAYARDAGLVMLLLALLTRTIISILDKSGFLDSHGSFLRFPLSKLIYYVLLPGPFVLGWLALARRATRRLYSLLAPAAIYGMVWPITYVNYAQDEVPLPAQIQKHRPRGHVEENLNVYIFVFDEWSYDRSFRNDHPWAELTNLQVLVRSSTCYQAAHSPASSTFVSMPMFVFQNDPVFRKMSYHNMKNATLKGSPRPERNIFSEAPFNWFTLAIGWWIDYPLILGSSVDYSVQIQNRTAWRSYKRTLIALLRSQVSWLRFLGFPIYIQTEPPMRLLTRTQAQVHQLARSVISQCNEPTLALFHYGLPHFPYAWNRYGLKDPLPDNILEHSVTNYLDNLRGMDMMLGEIIQELRESGKWDTSMLIFTSDHSWRWDPDWPKYDPVTEDADPNSLRRHVPLIVKMPGQRDGLYVFEPVATDEIYLMVRKVLESAAGG